MHASVRTVFVVGNLHKLIVERIASKTIRSDLVGFADCRLYTRELTVNSRGRRSSAYKRRIVPAANASGESIPAPAASSAVEILPPNP